MHWFFGPSPNPEVWLRACVQASKLPTAVQMLLLRMPFKDVAAVQEFLKPSLKYIKDPSKIKNLSVAVQHIHASCQANRGIAVVSDYDVDGVASMTLLHRFCKIFGFSFTPFFPKRDTEGYGLTERLVERILNQKKTFYDLIAIDCGTNSTEVVQQIQAAGISVIIIDHHQLTRENLPTAIVINPHTDETAHSESEKNLCSAGLVFKWLHAWLKLLRQDDHFPHAKKVRLRPFLDLVALATIADLVPLRYENRLFVYFGLKEMLKSDCAGLKDLMLVSSCSLHFPPSVEDISFKLAPCINAGGRLNSADIPYRLLTSEDASSCWLLAKQLSAINMERQMIERSIAQEAEAMILKRPRQYAYVLYQKHWHVGVVGIVAGKLTRKFHCPVFVLGEHGGQAKGSGRSIPDINLIAMLHEAQMFIMHWGGHPSAVGLTVELKNIAPLERCLIRYLKHLFPEKLPEPVLPIAATLSETTLTSRFLEALDRLAPFGQGNEMPIFAIKNIILSKPVKFFGKQNEHIKFKLNGCMVVGWFWGKACPLIQQPIDLAVRLGWLCRQSNRSLQMQLVDWRRSESEIA